MEAGPQRGRDLVAAERVASEIGVAVHRVDRARERLLVDFELACQILQSIGATYGLRQNHLGEKSAEGACSFRDPIVEEQVRDMARLGMNRVRDGRGLAGLVHEALAGLVHEHRPERHQDGIDHQIGRNRDERRHEVGAERVRAGPSLGGEPETRARGGLRASRRQRREVGGMLCGDRGVGGMTAAGEQHGPLDGGRIGASPSLELYPGHRSVRGREPCDGDPGEDPDSMMLRDGFPKRLRDGVSARRVDDVEPRAAVSSVTAPWNEDDAKPEPLRQPPSERTALADHRLGHAAVEVMVRFRFEISEERLRIVGDAGDTLRVRARDRHVLWLSLRTATEFLGGIDDDDARPLIGHLDGGQHARHAATSDDEIRDFPTILRGHGAGSTRDAPDASRRIANAPTLTAISPMRRGTQGWRQVLRVGVTLGIVVYILVDVDWGDLGRAIRGVDSRWLAAAACIYLASQVVSAFKWSLIGRALGFDRSFPTYVGNYYLGMFFNLFGPSTLGGDLARALYLARGRRRSVAINSVLFDRVSGLAVLMGLGAVVQIVAPTDFPAPLRFAVVAGGLGLLVGWWLLPRLAGLLPAGNRIRTMVVGDLAPLWTDRRMLARVALVSLCFHLTQVGQQWVVARAVGIELSLTYCLAFHPLLSVMMALPVSIAGFGVREGGYLYFLTRIDVDDSHAVTMGLLWWVVNLVGGLVGGMVFLGRGAVLPRLVSSVESDRPMEPETQGRRAAS